MAEVPQPQTQHPRTFLFDTGFNQGVLADSLYSNKLMVRDGNYSMIEKECFWPLSGQSSLSTSACWGTPLPSVLIISHCNGSTPCVDHSLIHSYIVDLEVLKLIFLHLSFIKSGTEWLMSGKGTKTLPLKCVSPKFGRNMLHSLKTVNISGRRREKVAWVRLLCTE